MLFRRRRDRDAKGRFVKGNRYRFELTRVNGFANPFLMQDPMYGGFFRAVKKGVTG